MFDKMKGLCFIALVCLISCQKTKYHIADAQIDYIRADQKQADDESIDSFIAPFRKDMRAEMDQIIGYLPVTLKKARPNSNLGNWFCDALAEQAEKTSGTDIDFAIQNYGGLRIPSLQEGQLTKGQIFELMPFDNLLVIIEVDGPTVQDLVNSMAESGGWPISKGLNFTITEDKKATDIKIGGADFDINKNYRVALPDYIANSAYESKYFQKFEQESTGHFIRQLIIDHVLEKTNAGDSLIIDSAKRIF